MSSHIKIFSCSSIIHFMPPFWSEMESSRQGHHQSHLVGLQTYFWLDVTFITGCNNCFSTVTANLSFRLRHSKQTAWQGPQTRQAAICSLSQAGCNLFSLRPHPYLTASNNLLVKLQCLASRWHQLMNISAILVIVSLILKSKGFTFPFLRQNAIQIWKFKSYY